MVSGDTFNIWAMRMAYNNGNLQSITSTLRKAAIAKRLPVESSDPLEYSNIAKAFHCVSLQLKECSPLLTTNRKAEQTILPGLTA